jgi:hypothetical protein
MAVCGSEKRKYRGGAIVGWPSHKMVAVASEERKDRGASAGRQCVVLSAPMFCFCSVFLFLFRFSLYWSMSVGRSSGTSKHSRVTLAKVPP